MPTADVILEGLATIAQSWKTLAVLWHIYCAVLLGVTLTGSRATDRLVGTLLVPLLASVSVLAWISANPFNGTAFGVLSIGLVALLRKLGNRPVERAPLLWLVVGAALVGFGWVYPHFLEQDPAFTYLYAAPLGLIPCPTLSLATGVTIMFSGLHSRAWSLVLACAALFYGAFGALYLGVSIDWVLAGGGLALFALAISPSAISAFAGRPSDPRR